MCLARRLVNRIVEVFGFDFSDAQQLIQNCDSVIKIGALGKKRWELGLSRHRSVLDECEVVSYLFHLVLYLLDFLLSCVCGGAFSYHANFVTNNYAAIAHGWFSLNGFCFVLFLVRF